jgi:glycerol-3-phosphate dehydrogenase
LPWHDAVLVGTTDLDHDQDLDAEPRTSTSEIAYLLAAVNHIAPQSQIGPPDIVATQAGIRPVVGSGECAPSDESREHVVWVDDGLVTVTGGKLTTFRRLAADALAAAAPWLPGRVKPDPQGPLFEALSPPEDVDAGLAPAVFRRLSGRYGRHWQDLVIRADPATLTPVAGSSVLWTELVHAARGEAVRHLADLLLRRVRLGLILPDGGRSLLPRIRLLCQGALGWDDARWLAEERQYLTQVERTAWAP